MVAPGSGSGKTVWESHWQSHVPSRGEKWLISRRQDLLSDLLADLRSRRGNSDLTVVEAGCGVGHNSYLLAGDARVIAVDISLAAIRLHRALYPASQAMPMVADISRFPLPSHSVDLIFSAGVLEHFTDVEKSILLREARRVLRSLGMLFVTVPGRYSFWHLRRGLRKLDFGYEEYHTPESIRAVTEANGFETIKTGGLDPVSLNTFLMRFFGMAMPIRGLPGGLNTEVFVVARPQGGLPE
jgi:SAM-dependent methyltransferase